MFAAISQSEAKADVSSPEDPVIQVNGRAEIRFKLGEHGTCLDHLYHHDPVRIVFPTPAEGDIPQATVITTSGGLTGGDKIAITTAVKQSARAMISLSGGGENLPFGRPECANQCSFGCRI